MNTIPEALDLWVELTEVDEEKILSSSDWGIYDINKQLKESLALEPDGTTTLLLLDYFVFWYLNDRTFQVSSLLDEQSEVAKYLETARSLRRVLAKPEIQSARSDFRVGLLAALASYHWDSKPVLDMVNDNHNLAFLRRDALKTVHTLRINQFLAGEPEETRPKYLEFLYEFWNVNSLLAAACSMPSGVFLALIREPDPIHSYFVFAIRNGGNLTLLTDKPLDAHPMQKHMTRRSGRKFAERIAKNHFPYELLSVKYDDRGDAFIPSKKEYGLVKYQTETIPLKPICDLEPDEIIWVCMVFDLIVRKFWKECHQEPQLSYTGEMVKAPEKLVQAAESALVPVSAYQPLVAEPIEVGNLTADKLVDNWERESTRQNEWMERRYKPEVDEALLNIIGRDAVPFITDKSSKLQLSLPEQDNWLGRQEIKYTLQGFDPTCFGIGEDIIKDQQWVARYNQAKLVMRAAKVEFDKRRDEVYKWCTDRVEANMPALLEAIRDGKFEVWDARHVMFTEPQAVTKENILTVREYDSNKKYHEAYGCGVAFKHNISFHSGWKPGTQWLRCYFNSTEARVLASFTPTTAPALASLCGRKVTELPDVLQFWTTSEIYGGNPILDRIDPMDWVVKDPWRELTLEVCLYLSKRSYARIKDSLPMARNPWPTIGRLPARI